MHHFYLFYPNGYVTLNDNEYILGIPFTTQFDKTLYCIKYYKVHNHHRTMDLQNAFHSSTWPSSNGRLLWADLAHWGQDQMAAISQTTMSNAFSWKKMLGFRLKFHWSFFPKGRINNIPSLVQIMAWRLPGDKPLSEPMMVRLPAHICVARPQWVKKKTTSYINIGHQEPIWTGSMTS